MLRVVEVCVVLVLISRLSLKLPVAVKNSSEYLREFSLAMNSPRFVFLIGNVIIITLFAQSGQFSTQGSSERNVPAEPDIYQEIVQKNRTEHVEKQSMRTEDGGGIEKWRIKGDIEKHPESDDGIYGEEGCDGIKNKRIEGGKPNWAEEGVMKTGDAGVGLEVKKGCCYRRCETEVFNKPPSRVRVLRRCESEKKRRESIEEAAAAGEEIVMAGISCPEDDMSNEEFRRTVEAFIAKQQRIRREEDYSSSV